MKNPRKDCNNWPNFSVGEKGVYKEMYLSPPPPLEKFC